jgi:hypothetical protein
LLRRLPKVVQGLDGKRGLEGEMTRLVHALKRLFCRHTLTRSRSAPGVLVCHRCGARLFGA